jgi:hypothetical protein
VSKNLQFQVAHITRLNCDVPRWLPVAGRRCLLGKAQAEYSMPLKLLRCGMKRSLDENDPDSRDPGLDTYDPRNPTQPPYSSLPAIAPRSFRACADAPPHRPAGGSGTLIAIARSGMVAQAIEKSGRSAVRAFGFAANRSGDRAEPGALCR